MARHSRRCAARWITGKRVLAKSVTRRNRYLCRTPGLANGSIAAPVPSGQLCDHAPRPLHLVLSATKTAPTGHVTITVLGNPAGRAGLSTDRRTPPLRHLAIRPGGTPFRITAFSRRHPASRAQITAVDTAAPRESPRESPRQIRLWHRPKSGMTSPACDDGPTSKKIRSARP
jgi:hypothetical protein